MTLLKKILLVDYEPAIAALVRRAFEAAGAYQVKEERAGRLAGCPRWFQPDLVLCDLVPAPSQSAAAARQQLEGQAWRDIPVVFARVEESEAGIGVSAGILSGYSFTAHPIPLEEMIAGLVQLLHPRSAPRTNTQDAIAA
ncbi:MAG: hypothetical protein ABI992_03895 [Chthoniobacterales bacterium]